jgi:uncharacterized protein (TIGR02145 family)
MLDVQSANKGFLPPRVALVSADSPEPITNPAAGLVVYNTATSGLGQNSILPGMFYWNGQRWKRINKEQVVAYPPLPDSCAASGSVMDIDGNVYPTVILGTQEWMAQNLKVLHLNDGTPINIQWTIIKNYPNGLIDIHPSSAGPFVEWWSYPDTWEISGLLYNYEAASNGLCPDGWHIPTLDDIDTLLNFISIIHYGDTIYLPEKLWAGDTTGCPNNYNIQYNETCFSALDAGYINDYGYYEDYGGGAYFWCGNPASDLYGRFMMGCSYIMYNIVDNNRDKYAFSVRCIKD